MPRHMLKLLALLAVFSVAPATARHGAAVATYDADECPYARARAEAAAQREGQSITLTDRVSTNGSLLGRSAVLSP